MPYFIAEISSNHNNSIKRIEKMIVAAKESGFDAVKFQVFKMDKLFHPLVLKKYKTHRDRKKWELNLSFIKQIKKICNKNKIDLGFTPFYLDAVDLLSPLTDFFKIASYEILWKPLIIKCAKQNKKLIISTGMAKLKEVSNALNSANKYLNKKKISLLHCVSSYPASFKNCNLASIGLMRTKFKCSIGWSDHTVDQDVILRAVNHWGAEDIELHFDLDGKGFEAGVGHCWLPKESKNLINKINKNNTMDGTFKKTPSVVESLERKWRADPIDGLRPLKFQRKKI